MEEKVVDIFKEPYKIREHEIYITISIGISIFPKDGRDAHALMKNADTSMYSAKENGRNNYRFYDASMSEEVRKRLEKQRSVV